MPAYLAVLITAASAEEGQRIARALVEAGLAACVNLVSSVRSIYAWQGQIHDDQEVLLIAKTKAHLLERLAAQVKQLHSYEVPEIIALPIVAGSGEYLRWLDAQTGTPLPAADVATANH